MQQQSLSIHAGYFDLLVYAGLTPLQCHKFGKGHGDYVFAVERDGRYGIIIIGFGSCAGCDVLTSVKPPPGVDHWDEENLAFIQIYATELAGNVHWGHREDLQLLLTHPDFALLRWYGHEPTFYPAIAAILEYIPMSTAEMPPAQPAREGEDRRKLLTMRWFDTGQDVTASPAIDIRVLVDPREPGAKERVRSELSQGLFRLLNQLDGMNDD